MTALGTGSSIQELQERRAYECRLDPGRALETLADAEAFLRERGLLTRTKDSALPSLFEACHEEPYAPDKPGFGQWPATRWWWGGALAGRAGVHELKVHRGKSLFVTDETAALLDPLCRAELGRDSPLLRHLAEAGPSTLEDLQLELSLRPRELRALRVPLEQCGAILSRQVDAGEDRTVTELARWDHVFPEPPAGGGIGEGIVAGVRAAVLAPEREAGRWFSWPASRDPSLVDGLVASGRLTRPAPGWLAAGTA